MRRSIRILLTASVLSAGLWTMATAQSNATGINNDVSQPVINEGTNQAINSKPSAAKTEPITPTYKNVLVATVPTFNNKIKDLRLNIYKPKDAVGPTPVLVFIHGGGWAAGTYAEPSPQTTTASPQTTGQTTSASSASATNDSRNSLMASDNRTSLEVFKEVVRHGITLVSIDYRLNSEAHYPAQIYDVKGAIRFIRAHADEYGIDPQRIAVSGTSAGAHLAVLLATTNNNPAYEGTVGGNTDYSSAVSAVIDYYGPTDLLTMAPEMSSALQSKEAAAETHDSPRAMESVLLGFNKPGQGVGVLRGLYNTHDTKSPYWPYVELALEGSPIYQVTPQTPPMFIAHGGRDTLVPIAQSYRLRDTLNANGVENLFISNSEAPHGNQGQLVNDTMIQWIVNKLKP